MLHSFFSDKCFHALNTIAAQLNLPEIESHLKCRILKHGTKNNVKGDFYLSLFHPSFREWFPVLELVSKKLLESSSTWEYPLNEVIVHEVSSQGHLLILFVDKEIVIPKVLRETSKFISSPYQSIPKVCDLIISTHSNNESDWNNLRIQCVCEALQSMTNSLSESSFCNLETIPIMGDLGEEEKRFCYKELERKSHRKGHSLIVNVSREANFVQPESDWSEVQVTEQVVFWVSKLYKVIKKRNENERSLNRVILVTNDVLFVPMHKSALLALSLLDTSSINVIVVPVSRVSSDWNLSDYSTWLKNYIITKSVVDEDEEGESVRVDEELVYNLYQTCLRLTLLSSPQDSLVKVEADKATQYIFIQYNIARLSLLIRRYQSEMQSDEESALGDDLSLLSSDEWNLIRRHVSNFIPLMNQVARNYAMTPFCHLINYLNRLCKDLSSYYRKVRILVQDLPHTRTLMKSRINFLRIIRRLLILSLKVMSVRNVEKM